MKKTLIFVALVLSMMVTLVIFGASADTVGTPIYNATDFTNIVTATDVEQANTNCYYFANDIDLGGIVIENNIWDEFSGTIDGNGYSLLNFSIEGNPNAGNDCGLIKVMGTVGQCTIKNLTVGSAEHPVVISNACKNTGVLAGATKNKSTNPIRITNVTIYAEISNPTNTKELNYGIFMGISQGYDVEFENCKSYGKIVAGHANDLSFSSYVNTSGFLAVYKVGTLVMKNCENYTDIYVNYSGKEARAAGFVSYLSNDLIIENCKNYGNLTVDDYQAYDPDPEIRWFRSDSYVGAIVADTADSISATLTINYCANYGQLTATNRIGAMVGRYRINLASEGCTNEGKMTSNAYYSDATSNYFFGLAEIDAENTTAINAFSNIGELVEYVTNTYAEDTTTAPADETTTAPADETTTAPADETTAPDGDDETTTVGVDNTTTEPVDNTTTKAPDTTAAPEEKGCGGIASVAIVIAAAVSVLGVAIIKKH